MTVEEMKAKAKEILSNPSDVGNVSSLLTEITDGFGAEFSSRTTAEAEIEKLKTENESLKENNMKLFLKVTSEPEEKQEEKETEKESELDFNSLFDEKGNLK